MGGFQSGASNTFGWAELSSRGVEKAIAFYETVFGWTDRESDMGEGQPPYNEFQIDGDSVAGAHGDEPDGAGPGAELLDDLLHRRRRRPRPTRRRVAAGAQEMVAPQDFPGGRFAIVTDPQGANFGLLKMAAR